MVVVVVVIVLALVVPTIVGVVEVLAELQQEEMPEVVVLSEPEAEACAVVAERGAVRIQITQM
jgi:hypothetical protein